MPTTLLKDRLDIAMRDASVIAADLARACGIKPASVSDWITGKTKTIKGANLLAAARLLGVTPEWLSTGRGPRIAQGSDSQLVRLDAEMLADTAWVMRTAYADVGRVFDMEAEPERFLQAYLARTKLVDIQSPDNVAAFLFTAAKLVSPQGASDERIDEVPTPGTGETDVGGRTRRRKA